MDARISALLAPVAELLPKPLRTLRFGDTARLWRLEADEIVLSERLNGPDPFLEEAGATPRVDRWRRAVQAVREATAAAEWSARWGLPYEENWVWSGFLVDEVDAALPALSLADSDVAAAIAGVSPGESPRAGVVVSRWWRAHGHEPAQRTEAILRGQAISAEEWLAIGAWVFQAGGAGAALPVAVPRAAPRDVPCELRPWSWVRLDVPAHKRGGFIRPAGDAFVADPWAPGGQRLSTIAGALGGGGYLHAEVGGPVGRWSMASARGFGQVFGARGIEFDFRGNGAWVVTLAAASAGPVSAVDDTLGTSGIATGTWVVDGASTIRLGGLRVDQLGVHAKGEKFAVPSAQFGLGPVLQAMQAEAWQWRVEGGRLVLSGRMFGGSVEVWYDAVK